MGGESSTRDRTLTLISLLYISAIASIVNTMSCDFGI